MVCPVWGDDARQLMSTDRAAGWSALRALGPVVRLDDSIVLTRRSEVLAALRDPSATGGAGRYVQVGRQRVPFNHLHRWVLARCLTPRRAVGYAERFRPVASMLITGVAARGHADIADLGRTLMGELFDSLCGLGADDTDSEGTVDIERVIANRLAAPGDDVVSGMLGMCDAATAAGLTLRLWTGCRSLAIPFVMAVWHLVARPGLAASLRAEPTRVSDFVEEVLRLESGSGLATRVLSRPAVVAGHPLPAGQHLTLALGAVNREEPLGGDELCLPRRGERHVVFGGGQMLCRAHHLIRAALVVLVQEWLAAMPDRLELPPGFVPAIWWPAPVTFGAWGLRELPLTWSANV